MRRAASSRQASVPRAIRRRPQRAAGAALALVVAALALWAVVELLAIRADLDGARRDLVEVDLVTLAQEPGGVEALVDRAADRLASAERRARTSPVLGLWGRLPVVRDQVGGLRDITGALAGIGERARDAGDAIQARLDRLDRGPSARIDLLDEVLAHLSHLRSEVQAADLGDASLAGPLRWERDDLEEQLHKARERLEDATGSVEAVRNLLVGPTRYLLLAGNNSEMRGTPMPLAAAILELEAGEITTGDFVQTGDLTLAPSDGVQPPPDLDALYDGLWGLGREWRMTTTTPRFPVAAAILAEMSARSSLGPVDGVLLIDSVTLGSLVDAVGGIIVDGELRTGSDVVIEVLNENYLELGTDAGRQARVELQGELAKTAFEQLTEASEAVLDLAARVPDLAAGRHLMAWTSDPEIQDLWEDLGADGEIPQQPLMVALQNASGSKRDWYLDPAVRISGSPTVSGRSVRVRIEVTLENPIIRPTTDFIQGTSRYIRPGEHRSFVTVYLPASAGEVTVRGEMSFRATGTDGFANVVTGWFRVPEGATRSFMMEFDIPAADVLAEIVPSARVRPVRYEVNGREVLDSEPMTISWYFPPPRGEGVARPLLLSVAAVAVAAALRAAVAVGRQRWVTRPR